MRYVETAASGRVQVVVTTHSPNLASTPSVERITVLSRARPQTSVLARSIKDFGLDSADVGHLHRFLDVTKASLLFARGVLLVEGVAEQLTVPAIAKQLDRPLARYGIAVVNIGGLAFRPFAALFGPERLPYRCALLTDSDPPEDEEAPEEAGSDDEAAAQGEASAGGSTPPDEIPTPAEDGAQGATVEPEGPVGDGSAGPDVPMSAASAALSSLENENVRVFRAQETFEWDLVHAGNWDLAVEALGIHFPRVAKRLRKETAGDNASQADAFLQAVERRKGIVAQELLALTAAGRDVHAPSYIEQAILWLTEQQDELSEQPDESAGAVSEPAGNGSS
jgi:putative ATP-dependent endonuclease of OLD family